jgi:hypothetical protein
VSCKTCGQTSVMTATLASADLAAIGTAGCRVCAVTRLALLWMLGAGAVGVGLVYWFFGPFTGCNC